MSDDAKTGGMGKKLGMGCLIVVGVFIVLVIIGAIVGGDEGGSTGSDEQQAAVSASEALPVTATEISAAYQQNEAKAQLTYGKKPLLVTGVVKDITLDFADDPVISLRGAGDQYDMGVNQDGKMTDVSVNGIGQEQAAEIQKGAEMTFLCADVSEVLGGPQLSDCRISD